MEEIVMAFYPEPQPVPGGLTTTEFILQPLTPDHVELDFAALMDSREMLRLWSGSPWPADDFTPAENLQDLTWHWDEHQKRIAFTYTVLNPSADACLGCVYIKPNPYAENAALVRFWVTSPRLADRLDYRLLAALIAWLHEEWAFAAVTFHTPTTNAQQIRLFTEAGLTAGQIVAMPDRGGDHQLFHP